MRSMVLRRERQLSRVDMCIIALLYCVDWRSYTAAARTVIMVYPYFLSPSCAVRPQRFCRRCTVNTSAEMLCCAAVHCAMLREINFHSSAVNCLFLLLLFYLPAPLTTMVLLPAEKCTSSRSTLTPTTEEVRFAQCAHTVQ